MSIFAVAALMIYLIAFTAIALGFYFVFRAIKLI